MKKLILMPGFCLAVFAIVFSYKGNAQSLSSDDIKVQMVKDWERAKAYTVDYLNTMPADKYSLKRLTASAVLHNRCCTWHQAICFLCLMPAI